MRVTSAVGYRFESAPMSRDATHVDAPRPSAAGVEAGRLLKTTRSICPDCLCPIDASVYERSGQIWMDKRCEDHGAFSALLASDPRHYYQADPAIDAIGSCCSSGCGPRHAGDQTANHSCNMLIEITQRCNLTCPTCYADSSPERDETMSYEAFVALIESLIAKGKGDADVIALSGGEPTIHPRMFDMIEAALDRGFQQVYINTNGVKLARPEFADRVAAFGSRVSVYLQFDGFRERTLKVLRGRDDLQALKMRALAHCESRGIATVPVMTMTPDVNDDEVGAFLALGSSHRRSVRKVMIQPAMYSGRYENPQRIERATVADVIARIVEQTGTFVEDDFTPIPCSDPNCFSMALAVRTKAGLMPVSRFFPRYDTWADEGVRDLIAEVTDTFDSAPDLTRVIQWAASSPALQALDETVLDALLEQIVGWQSASSDQAGWGDLFAIGIKPFMDAYTYDQDRVDKCCVHIISTEGEPVSFCEYNAIRRPRHPGR